MAKFNKTANKTPRRVKTTNYEGHEAYELDAPERLFTRLCTSFINEKKFYVDGKTHDKQIVKDIDATASVDPELVLKMGAFARTQMYMRSSPVFLLVHAAQIPECRPFVRKWAPKIVRRADELCEVMALQIAKFGKKAPNSLRKGLADAFANFDEYQLNKYNRKGAVTFRDVLRLTHPKPANEARSALYKALSWGFDSERLTDEERALLPIMAANKALTARSEFDAVALELIKQACATWEVAISQFGNKPEVWDALRLPFMAMLRNLRNMIIAGASDGLKRAREALMNPDLVRRSKQFPFRFLSAFRELTEGRYSMTGVPSSRIDKIVEALSAAMESSVDNVPKLKGVTAFAVDNSGSMTQAISSGAGMRRGARAVTYKDIANCMGAIGEHMSEEAIVIAFGTDVCPVTFPYKMPILSRIDRISIADTLGFSTNAFRVCDYLTDPDTTLKNPLMGFGREGRLQRPSKSAVKGPIKVDRIVLLSDMQCWNSTYSANAGLQASLRKYRSAVGYSVWLHSIDLTGYGTTQFTDDRVSLIAGWSDKVLKFIDLAENKHTMLDQIETLTPSDV